MPVFDTQTTECNLTTFQCNNVPIYKPWLALRSCTIKLNATEEMIPISSIELAQPHAFAPAEQIEGYR